MPDPVRRGLRAYHGSPHRFDRFDIGKLGTGEGAQAYGHGLYFAESEDVARHYRDTLTNSRATFRGAPLRDAVGERGSDHDFARYQFQGFASPEDALTSQRDEVARWRAEGDPYADVAQEKLERMLRLAPEIERPPGHMYEVDLNIDPARLLDWDKPLREQPRAADYFSLMQTHGQERNGADAYRWLAQDKGGADRASAQLLRSGFPGLQYLDGVSRRAGDGDRNIVTFDDAPVSILRRYRAGGAVAGLEEEPVCMASGGVVPYEGGGRVGRGIRAFHGSPHAFDRFDIGRLGSGEGSQAYGHGLYFAENEDVATAYRDSLSGRSPLLSAQNWPEFERIRDLRAGADKHRNANLLVRSYEDSISRGADPAKLQEWLDEARAEAAATAEVAAQAREAGLLGHMYEVDLNLDRRQLLDWDLPLRDQPQANAIHGAMADHWRQMGEVNGSTPEQRASRQAGVDRAFEKGSWTGREGYMDLYGYGEGPDAASRKLLERGIPGIQYLDHFSRQGLAPSETRNIVTFDDAPVSILRRYAEGGAVAGLEEEHACMASGGVVGYEGGGRVGAGIRAFHGSPHRFDRFDISKLGSGEGAQAYGHGLYFTDSEGVARSYRDKLQSMSAAHNTIDGRRVNPRLLRELADHEDPDVARFFREDTMGKTATRASFGDWLHNVSGDLDRQIGDFQSRHDELVAKLADGSTRPEWNSWQPEAYLGRISALQARRRQVGAVADRFQRVPAQGNGAMYEVRLNLDPDDLLNWDRPANRDRFEQLRGLIPDQRESLRVEQGRMRPSGSDTWVDAWSVHGGPGAGRALDGPHLSRDAALRAADEVRAMPLEQLRDLYLPDQNMRGEMLHVGLSQALGGKAPAAAALNEAGIPGVQYLNGASRAQGYGGSNYVTFDDEPVEILRRYRAGGAVAGLGEEPHCMAGGGVVPYEGGGRVGRAIRAFHGSAKAFDDFDVSYRGTGHGAQPTHGAGLSFSSSRRVADYHREALAGTDPGLTLDDQPLLEALNREFGDLAPGARLALETANQRGGVGQTDAALRYPADELGRAARAWWDENRSRVRASPKPNGSLYEVRLNLDPASLLDWDAPLSRQPAPVRDRLQQLPGFRAALEAEASRAAPRGREAVNPPGYRLYDLAAPGDPVLGAQRLNAAGVPGVAYRDLESRDILDSARAARGYTTFDDAPVEIMSRSPDRLFRRFAEGGLVEPGLNMASGGVVPYATGGELGDLDTAPQQAAGLDPATKGAADALANYRTAAAAFG